MKALTFISSQFVEDVYLLDEPFMGLLKCTFDSNPTCYGVLSAVADSMSPIEMFKTGLKCIGNSDLDHEIRELAFEFGREYGQVLKTLFRKIIRSVLIYGFAVLRDGVDGCPPTLVPDDGQYVVFRDNVGNLHARGVRSGGVEKLRVVCLDAPSALGRVTSAMSHVQCMEVDLRQLMKYRDDSYKYACKPLLVVGLRTDNNVRDSNIDQLDNQMTQRAIRSVATARGVPASNASIVDLEMTSMQTEKEKIKMIGEFANSKIENSRLRQELTREKICRVFGIEHTPSGELLENEELSTNKVLADHLKLEAHNLKVSPLDISEYQRMRGRNLLGTLLGNPNIKNSGGGTETSSRRLNEIGSQEDIDRCSYNWQSFITQVVLCEWLKLRRFTMMPVTRKGLEDLKYILPLINDHRRHNDSIKGIVQEIVSNS